MACGQSIACPPTLPSSQWKEVHVVSCSLPRPSMQTSFYPAWTLQPSAGLFGPPLLPTHSSSLSHKSNAHLSSPPQGYQGGNMYPPQKSGSAPSPGPPGPAPPAGYQGGPRRHPDFEKTQPPGKMLHGSGYVVICVIFSVPANTVFHVLYVQRSLIGYYLF